MSAHDDYETDSLEDRYASYRDLKRLKKIFRNTNRTLEEFANWSHMDILSEDEYDEIYTSNWDM